MTGTGEEATGGFRGWSCARTGWRSFARRSSTPAARSSIRTTFESNFPVDRTAISYPVLWNAVKKIAATYDAGARDALFAGTARRVYDLPSTLPPN